jgi:hypothetical protein
VTFPICVIAHQQTALVMRELRGSFRLMMRKLREFGGGLCAWGHIGVGGGQHGAASTLNNIIYVVT